MSGGRRDAPPLAVHLTYWIPRQYATTISTDDIRAAAEGTCDQARAAAILDRVEAGLPASDADTEQLAAILEEHGHYLLVSDDEHQSDSDCAQDFHVELARTVGPETSERNRT